MAPDLVKAQADWVVPAYCTIQLEGSEAVYARADVLVLVSASGNVKLIKANFDVSGWDLALKENGTSKIVVDRLTVWVYGDMDMPTYHFTANDVNVFVSPDGIASVVYNWQVGDMDVSYMAASSPGLILVAFITMKALPGILPRRSK